MLERLQRIGIRRGLLGTSRAWTVVAVAAFGIRQLRRVSQRQQPRILTEELAPGESVVITHLSRGRS